MNSCTRFERCPICMRPRGIIYMANPFRLEYHPSSQSRPSLGDIKRMCENEYSCRNMLFGFWVLGFPGIEGSFKVREFRVWLGELVWYPGTIDLVFNGSVASSWIHENNEMVSVLLDTRADDWHQKVPSYSSIECQIFDIILAPIGVSP